jgi:hypothetical protein
MRGSGKTIDEELISAALDPGASAEEISLRGGRRSLKPERCLNVAIKRLSTRSDGPLIKRANTKMELLLFV